MARVLTLLLVLASVWPAARAQDAQRGATKVQMCIGCHGIPGYQTDFPQVYKVPLIAGQDAKYIESALKEYRSGARKHPTMRAIAGSLSDQDIADIAAYYSRLGRPAGALPAKVTVPSSLQATLATCSACHGANFSSPTDGSIPRLAGQHPDYLAFALRAYQTDGNPSVGRTNAMMNPMAKPLSPAEVEQIADYLGSLPSQLRTVPEPRFK